MRFKEQRSIRRRRKNPGHFITRLFLKGRPGNERNQRKRWRVNFHDHHRCASRSHNETKLKRFGITATTAIGWGQEEGMDEDTAM